MKILLAIDDSKFSEAALQTVIAQNRPQETEVRVMHTVEQMDVVFPMVDTYSIALEEVRKVQMQQASELVAKAAGKLKAAGFDKVETFVHEGTTRLQIVDMAEQWPANMIVVGSHGRKGLDRFLLGSVSDYVARHARCSVEIVRLSPAK